MLDFGRTGGLRRFTDALEAGREVRLCFGELLQVAAFTGTICAPPGGVPLYLRRERRAVRPHFTYFGFRYVKVEG